MVSNEYKQLLTSLETLMVINSSIYRITKQASVAPTSLLVPTHTKSQVIYESVKIDQFGLKIYHCFLLCSK